MEIKQHSQFGKVITDSGGRIAYHTYRFTDSGGIEFVQFDFEGKELFKQIIRTPILVSFRSNP